MNRIKKHPVYVPAQVGGLVAKPMPVHVIAAFPSTVKPKSHFAITAAPMSITLKGGTSADSLWKLPLAKGGTWQGAEWNSPLENMQTRKWKKFGLRRRGLRLCIFFCQGGNARNNTLRGRETSLVFQTTHKGKQTPAISEA